jgi:hypothetical protein
MWVNQMQAALAESAIKANDKRWVKKVVKAADKQKLEDPKPRHKLSFRTAMKLKAAGVIE